MSSRVILIAANWKMNKTQNEAIDSAKKLVNTLSDIKYVDVFIAPPFTSVSIVADILKKSNISIAAQNLFWESYGAFTGEISPDMLKDLGCKYVIIGHSERRLIFNETHEIINKKIKAAIKSNLNPVFCIGENKFDRDKGKIFSVLDKQIRLGLKGIFPEDFAKIIVAYEPIWAIGTGNTATDSQVQETHLSIRSCLRKLCSFEISENIKIIYGGSVNLTNIESLITLPDVDGVLVGKASLEIDVFSELVCLSERSKLAERG